MSSIFEYQDAPAAYPHLTSEGADELIGWGALSGLVADEDGMIYAVNDSFLRLPAFDLQDRPQPAARPHRGRDPHPPTGRQPGTESWIWRASRWTATVASTSPPKGRTDRVIPHAIYHVSADGLIKDRKGEIGLPAELMAVEKRFGFRGHHQGR